MKDLDYIYKGFEKQEKEKQEVFEKTFNTEYGRKALLLILEDLGYFDETIEVNDYKANALKNYGTRLLRLVKGADFLYRAIN